MRVDAVGTYWQNGCSWVPSAAFAYLLTLCSTVLPEKLTVPQLIKKFPSFFGTREFIATFTSARHLSPSHSKIHYIIILPSAPESSKSLFHRFPHLNPVYTSALPIHGTWPTILILLDLITLITFGEEHISLISSLYSCSTTLLPRRS